MLKSLEGTNSLDLQSNENREKGDFNVGFTPWPHFMEFSRLETDYEYACMYNAGLLLFYHDNIRKETQESPQS